MVESQNIRPEIGEAQIEDFPDVGDVVLIYYQDEQGLEVLPLVLTTSVNVLNNNYAQDSESTSSQILEDAGAIYQLYFEEPGIRVVCTPKYPIGDKQFTFYASVFTDEYPQAVISSLNLSSFVQNIEGLVQEQKEALFRAFSKFQEFLITGGITSKGNSIPYGALDSEIEWFTNVSASVSSRYVSEEALRMLFPTYQRNIKALLVPPFNKVTEELRTQSLDGNKSTDVSRIVNNTSKGSGKILFQLISKLVRDSGVPLAPQQITFAYENLIKSVYSSDSAFPQQSQTTRFFAGVPVGANALSQPVYMQKQSRYFEPKQLRGGDINLETGDRTYTIVAESKVAGCLDGLPIKDRFRFLRAAIKVQQLFSEGFILDVGGIREFPKLQPLPSGPVTTVGFLRSSGVRFNRYRRDGEEIVLIPPVQYIMGNLRDTEYHKLPISEQASILAGMLLPYLEDTYPGIREGDLIKIISDIFAVDPKTGVWLGGKPVSSKRGGIREQKLITYTRDGITYISPETPPEVLKRVVSALQPRIVPYSSPYRHPGFLRGRRDGDPTNDGGSLTFRGRSSRPLFPKDGESRSGLPAGTNWSLGLGDVEVVNRSNI